MGRQSLALLKQLEAAAQAADDLAEATRLVFQQHPQVAIFTSFPGLGELPAARLLAEIGDDSTRFADARGLKAYAGAAPVTRASGKRLRRAPPQGKEPAPRLLNSISSNGLIRKSGEARLFCSSAVQRRARR